MNTMQMYYGQDALGVMTNDVASIEATEHTLEWTANFVRLTAGDTWMAVTQGDAMFIVLQHVSSHGMTERTVTYTRKGVDNRQVLTIELWSPDDRANPETIIHGTWSPW